jgi:hypothetical protein
MVIRDGVQIRIFEGLWNRPSSLRIVSETRDLYCVDVLIKGAPEVNIDGDGAGEIKLRVQCAGAVARLYGGGRGELINVAGAGGGSVQACLDAVAGGLNFREREV